MIGYVGREAFRWHSALLVKRRYRSTNDVASHAEPVWCGTPDSLLANAPTDKELSRARWCHLLALPGMLVLAVLVDVASDRVGYLSLVPLNLLIPFVYWLPQLKSRFVRSHGKEVLNFQLLWSLAVYAIWFVPFPLAEFVWWPTYFTVWLGGMVVVFIASNDAASAGDGRYPIRIPLFR